MTSAAPPPPGWRAATCPRCGAAFSCGAGAPTDTPCGCAAVHLPPERLAELRARYADCLCGACLKALADSSWNPRMTSQLSTVVALTLDLDDTLWPVKPPLVAAERTLAEWLAVHAPLTSAGMGPGAMLALRAEVAAEHPQWAHDLTAIRMETIRRALRRHGEDPALAEAAFEAFFETRHQVSFYEDVLPALERLAGRFRLVAVSNGNAELARVGLDRFFVASVSARHHGAAKPQASIFHAACVAAGATPATVLHLGDDPAMDVDGALAAGLHAGWICRPDGGHVAALPRPGAHRFEDLLEVALALGA